MKMFIKIWQWVSAPFLYNDLDPVKHCKTYNSVGCAHVDGIGCDMETCTFNNIEK